MNPTNPETHLLTRRTRRVLFHLLKGGVLERVFCNRLGDRAKRPDPARWYFTLFPNRGEGGPRPFCANKPIRPSYFVSRGLVELLAERGYLKPMSEWRERGEARRCDLILPAAEEVVAKTDENGNIRTRPIPGPLVPFRRNKLKKDLQKILERSRT